MLLQKVKDFSSSCVVDFLNQQLQLRLHLINFAFQQRRLQTGKKDYSHEIQRRRKETRNCSRLFCNRFFTFRYCIGFGLQRHPLLQQFNNYQSKEIKQSTLTIKILSSRYHFVEMLSALRRSQFRLPTICAKH